MKPMIAGCGLDCTACPVFIATRENSDEKREKVAREWSKLFKYEFKKEDMNCEGCKSAGGRLFGHCANCDIRKCVSEKKIENCAHCGDYACEKLAAFLTFLPNPAARQNLEKIRAAL